MSYIILFFPLTFTVFVRIQNTFRKIRVAKVMCIVFRERDKSIMGFFKLPFCGGFSLHRRKMVCMATYFARPVNFLKVYRNSLILTSI